jgi:hypothetical protein
VGVALFDVLQPRLMNFYSGSEPRPLDILCEQALKLDASVRFQDPELDIVMIDLEYRPSDEETENGDVFELEGLHATSILTVAECIADLLYERHLDARLEQAFLNKLRNTKRYAQTSKMIEQANKHKHAHLHEPRKAQSRA